MHKSEIRSKPNPLFSRKKTKGFLRKYNGLSYEKVAKYYIQQRVCENDLKIFYREANQSWEMYNLQEDPEEVNNIIEYSSEIEKMKSKLKPRINRWAN